MTAVDSIFLRTHARRLRATLIFRTEDSAQLVSLRGEQLYELRDVLNDHIEGREERRARRERVAR